MAGVRNRLTALILAAIAALAAAACGGESGADKAGGGKPVVLRLANINGQLDFTPAVVGFVDRVRELSGGDLRIEPVNDWGDLAADAEQRVVEDVAAGEVDLGWVGTRVFDTLHVRSFQALTAPMLIDSYALEGAVIQSGITEQMLRGLDDLGVAGLGVLPDGLRKPIGVSGPILGPADWDGITFSTVRSDGHADAVRALAATPAQVGRTARERRLKDGTIQGLETSIWIHQHNPALTALAPYVTSNVTLWPQMDVLLANPARLRSLTVQQRHWLEQAARFAATRAAAVADADADAIADSCATGARFAQASAADRAALQAAFAPVYASLRQDPETKAFIEQIRALKRSTTPEAAPAVPSGCTGTAPAQTAVGSGTAPARLNGTYRFVISKKDATKAGDPEADQFPSVQTWTLKDGRADNSSGLDGRYSVKGDRITFQFFDFDYANTFTFRVDEDGTLHLTPVPPMDPGDAFLLSHEPWTKIG
jgi:TRAP-type C4-dicarboxylate transport system substrate-binding protein